MGRGFFLAVLLLLPLTANSSGRQCSELFRSPDIRVRNPNVPFWGQHSFLSPYGYLLSQFRWRQIAKDTWIGNQRSFESFKIRYSRQEQIYGQFEVLIQTDYQHNLLARLHRLRVISDPYIKILETPEHTQLILLESNNYSVTTLPEIMNRLARILNSAMETESDRRP